MEDADSQTGDPKRKRRWYQFSLRTLLVFVLVSGVLFGWIGSILKRLHDQRSTVARIQQLGGSVTYDYGPQDSPPGPKLLRAVLGDDAFARVEAANIPYDATMSAADFELPARLPDLKWLMIFGTKFGDSELERLRVPSGLPCLHLKETRATVEGLAKTSFASGLRGLTLEGPTATDVRLDRVGRLKDLENLTIFNVPIAAGGLAPLRDLRQLQTLTIAKITLAGDDTSSLAALHNLERLVLFQTKLDDNGLQFLAGLENLEHLDLSMTDVSDADLERISKLPRLRTLDLEFTNVSDAGIPHLVALTGLRWIRIGPGITKPGVDRMREALPTCSIHYASPGGRDINYPPKDANTPSE